MGKRIAVVGTGALGGYVGGYLAHAGHDVTLIDFWPENIEIIRKRGLELDGVTPEELAKAKEGYLQARKISRADDASLAGMLTRLRDLDRTAAFEGELDRNISTLTPEQVGAALRKYIDPKAIYGVSAGDLGTTNTPPVAVPST